MNHNKFTALAITIALVMLVVTGCGTIQAPASLVDTPVCPTSAPLSCPTAQTQSCPTTSACPTAAAVQVPTNPTLTFNVAIHQCSYSGPKTLAYGGFTLDIVVGQIPEGYDIGFAMGTLKEGKTIKDLIPILSVEPPNWVNVLGNAGPFAENMSFTYDLSTMGNYSKGEPVFLVCFSGPVGQPIKIGTIGLFEVQE